MFKLACLPLSRSIGRRQLNVGAETTLRLPYGWWHPLFQILSVTHGGHPFIFAETGFSSGRNEPRVEMTLKRKAVRLSVTHESFPEEEIRRPSYGFAKKRIGFWFVPLEPPEIVVLPITGGNGCSDDRSRDDGVDFATRWFWLSHRIPAALTKRWTESFCSEQPVWLALFRRGHGPDT